MTVQVHSRELLAKSRKKIEFPVNFRLADHLREIAVQSNDHRVYEFIGTDNFGAEWQARQRYEVDAGRDEEPILYTPIYDEVRDPNLPKNVSVNRIGPGGVVFEEVLEGGEVKFSSITSSEFSVPIRHWATGLEYSKDLVVFNELWSVAITERAVGVAHNALLNHLHFSPIISATYGAANQTPANTSGADLIEDVFLTIQDAITASKTDTTNPRRGPYILLVSSSDLFKVEMALTRVPQQGFARQSSAIDMIRSIIAYDGWIGTRGRLTTTYPGVTAGKGYLISQQYRGQDFISFVKQDLTRSPEDQRDISRFLTQTVWDSYWGVYANPLRAVEEITWPT